MSFVVKKVIIREDGTRSRDYDQISICSPVSVNHFLIVKADGKYGMIDENGYELCPPEFDELKPPAIGEDVLEFRIGDQHGFIDRQGKKV